MCAPNPASVSMACSTAARTPSSSPAAKYSAGTPSRNPASPPSAASSNPAAKSSAGSGREVESRASCPAMALRIRAQSSAVRAMGPTWSSDEA